MTGRFGGWISAGMMKQGTKVVAGVTPGKGGQRVFGVPIFDSVEEALAENDANVSFLLVPARYVKDGVIEALDAGIKTLIAYPEMVPVHDALQIVNYARLKGATLFGPASAGVVSPGKANVSDIVGGHTRFLKEGKIGIVSKSATIVYEVLYEMSRYKLGQSTILLLGGDPVVGTTFVDALKLFEKDDDTQTVVLISEIGGTAEIEAKYIKKMSKPVFAHVCGRSAPTDKRMGHAGAIITRGRDTALAKMQELSKASAIVATSIFDIPKLITEKSSVKPV